MPRVLIALILLVAGIAAIAGIYVTSTQPRNQAGRHGAPVDRLANFRRVDPPAPLPDLAVTDMSGAPRHLKDFAGKVILLNFWATWCAPCREEMPALDRLEAKLGGPTFQVVPISLDQAGAERVADFLRREHIAKLKPLLDPASASLAAFGLLGLPTSILVDAQGREVGRLLGPAKWDSSDAVALIERTSAATTPHAPAQSQP